MYRDIGLGYFEEKLHGRVNLLPKFDRVLRYIIYMSTRHEDLAILKGFTSEKQVGQCLKKNLPHPFRAPFPFPDSKFSFSLTVLSNVSKSRWRSNPRIVKKISSRRKHSSRRWLFKSGLNRTSSRGRVGSVVSSTSGVVAADVYSRVHERTGENRRYR